MAMNIKDPETEQLAVEVAGRTGETKTAAVREALRERRDRLAREATSDEERRRFHRFLEEEIWSQLPAEELDQPPLSKPEVESILGIGSEGW